MKLSTRKIISCLVMLSIVSCLPALADETTKAAKLRELMELSGMGSIIEQARNKSKLQAINYKQEILTQMRDGFKIKDQEVWDQFEVEYQKFIDLCEPKWTIKEAVGKYTELYGARMTESEIDIVLEFSKSEVGKKSTAVSKEVAPIWYEYLAKDGDKQFNEGLHNFVNNMKLIIAEKKKSKQ